VRWDSLAGRWVMDVGGNCGNKMVEGARDWLRVVVTMSRVVGVVVREGWVEYRYRRVAFGRYQGYLSVWRSPQKGRWYVVQEDL
jgi:hypothetical protein